MNTSCASPAAPPDAPQRPRLGRWLWWSLPALVFVGLLWPKIDAGTLWYHDELLTANRAREMIVRGDPGTLTLNFTPDFRKPPLQYWLCALALRAFPGRPELAVRLPSLLCGAACLLALAWLARTAYPRDAPGTAWCAVLALAGCGYYILMSRLGLLDTGAALWLILAVAGCQRARADPRWWWFVALACVVGAWQKAPYAFAAWGVVLAVRACSASHPTDGDLPRARHRSARVHLAGALFAAVLTAAAWWLLQVARHGSGTVYASIWRQARAMTYAHQPEDAGFHPYLYWFWLARDWGLPGVCAPVAVVAALWKRSRRDGPVSSLDSTTAATTEIGWVCALYLLALTVTPFRTLRYLIVITPLLSLLTVRWLGATPAWLPLPSRWRVETVRRWLLAGALATTLPTALFHYFSRTPAWPELRAAARALAHDLPPGETVLIADAADPTFFVTNFAAFYGDLRVPWLEVRPADTGALPTPCRGLCHRRQWPELVRACPTARPLATQGDWIVWTRQD